MKSMNQKIPVVILGATGMVGQKFIELLVDHPWFDLIGLAASENSIGKKLQDLVNIHFHNDFPSKIREMKIEACKPNFPCKLVFSALDSKVAYEIEKEFADAGYIVVSNAKNHRMDPTVPLVIPEINPDHLQLLTHQPSKGKIITNPNCSTIGLCLALKPIIDELGIDLVHVTTMQAVSGAGYPGVASLDILENVVPFIDGEEEKIENEPLKIFGKYFNGKINPEILKISAQCNRVPVQDGHLECVSIKLKKKASEEQLLSLWKEFSALPQTLQLPSAPKNPLIYLMNEKHPQPKIHRNLGNGMSVSIGRLRPCPLFEYKFVVLSHNTIRGAAGSTILIGELLYKLNYIK